MWAGWEPKEGFSIHLNRKAAIVKCRQLQFTCAGDMVTDSSLIPPSVALACGTTHSIVDRTVMNLQGHRNDVSDPAIGVPG